MLRNILCSATVAPKLARTILFTKQKISRFATVPNNLDLTLYQYKICPFCNKVKALLDFYNIHYKIVEVNPLTKAEISFSKEYKKVPIGKFGEILVTDSSKIIENILEKIQFQPDEKELFVSESVQKWVSWADTELAVLLFPNITRSFSESYEAFSYVKNVPTFSVPQKYMNLLVGSTAMWAAQGRLKKKYNIQDERAALNSAIETFLQKLGGKDFLFGSEPTLADIAVFGVLKSIEGLRTHNDVLQNKLLQSWYNRVESKVGSSKALAA